MYHYGHREYLSHFLILSPLKYCINDYLVAFIWFSIYYFCCQCQVLYCCIATYRQCVFKFFVFFSVLTFFFPHFMSEVKHVCISSNRIWIKVHISGCPSWVIILLDLGNSTIVPGKGTTEQLTYCLKISYNQPSACGLFLIIWCICESHELRFSV